MSHLLQRGHAPGSSIANGRPDAWGCTTSGGVLDPCFENSFVAPDEATEVACLDTPWSTEVVMLTLTAPLSREGGPAGADRRGGYGG